MIIKTLLKIFLLMIVPLMVLGFNVFEKTEIYSFVFKTGGVESAIINKLTTNFDNPKKLIITQHDDKEFDHVWQLIKENTKHPVPNWKPQIISRIAVENGTSVTLPNRGKIILVPENTPIIALKATPQEVSQGKATGNDSFMVGTIGDLKSWLERKKKSVRATIDMLIVIVSIILGLFVEFGFKEKTV
jgi:hypothetical protein